MLGQLRFEDARKLVGYMRDLGIGAAYLAPFFRACRGSTHGYDVADPRQIDPQVGTEDDLKAFAEDLRRANLGLVLDVVPNHMGIDDPHNVWWQDVLENGPSSPHAEFFDIDWDPPKSALQGKILLAVLGDQFGKVLEAQQLQLIYEEQNFFVRYFNRRFPTDHHSWTPILKRVVEHVSPILVADNPQRMELESIVTALEHLPSRSGRSPDAVQERYREKEIARRRLANLVTGSIEVRDALSATLLEYNGHPDDPPSFNLLEAFLNDQPYRLAYWRVATDEINYRRFFDVDTLAAIRVEQPSVFEEVHVAVFRFLQQGWVTGLRVDHADGLLDPQVYLETLRQRGQEQLAARADAPEVSSHTGGTPYLIVEKILGLDESLPQEWPVDGATGYEFLNWLNGLLADRKGVSALRTAYVNFTRQWDSFAQVLFDSKRTILGSSLSSELYVLSNQLVRIADQHRWSRDFTRPSLHRALRDVVACFQVYRTYIRPGVDTVRDADRRRIKDAVRLARRRNAAMSPSFFDFIQTVLLLEDPAGLTDDQRQARREFVLKFQQVTGPIAAKGLEDTAFYRFYPLASLNEVGGDPALGAITPDQFHRLVQERKQGWPSAMSSTGTHDTKRGEDVRARLNVLSEIPEPWIAAIQRWQTMNAGSKRELDGVPSPDANEEYLIYQTLAGTWPLNPVDDSGWEQYVNRIVQYCEKAFHEAKTHTSWLSPDPEFDQAVAEFVRGILADRDSAFVGDMGKLVASIADAGFLNSLSQVLVKICAPGVPDFYQGVELWDFNLVDPDNRRPVDFAKRKQILADLKTASDDGLEAVSRDLLDKWPDERLKMFVTWRGLQTRQAHRDVFEGDYIPLPVTGQRDVNVCAFARRSEGAWAVCIVPRLTHAAWNDGAENSNKNRAAQEPAWPHSWWWRETLVHLPAEAPQRWRHALSDRRLATGAGVQGGQTLDAAEVFETFPVALLISEKG